MSQKNKATDSRTRSERHDSRKGKPRSGRLSIIIGVLLILIAIALLLLDPIKNYMISEGIKTNTIANITREHIVANKDREDVTYDFSEISYIDPMTVISDGVNPSDLPVVGGIAIPGLEMNLPINLGTSNEGMYYGAGTLDPNQQMGVSNYPLASHNSSNPQLLFAPLLEAKMGDMIYLTDLDRVYVYEIDTIEIVPPTAIEVLDPTETPIVTLITCTSDLVNRVIIQGTLIEDVAIAEADRAVMDAFDLPQTTAGQ